MADDSSIAGLSRLYTQFTGSEAMLSNLALFIGRRLAAVRDEYGEAEALAVASQAGIPNSRAAAFLAAAAEVDADAEYGGP